MISFIFFCIFDRICWISENKNNNECINLFIFYPSANWRLLNINFDNFPTAKTYNKNVNLKIRIGSNS